MADSTAQRGCLSPKHEEIWASLIFKEKEKALFFEDPKLIERAYNISQSLFVLDVQHPGVMTGINNGRLSNGQPRQRLLDFFEWAWFEDRSRAFPATLCMKKEFLRRQDFFMIVYERLGAQPKEERNRAAKPRGKPGQPGLPLSRAAAARTWINLFERTANSWAEFESMLARLILAAIMQKCLEVEAEREEEERKAKVAMHSSENDDLLLEKLLADDEGEKKKKKKKNKKKKTDVEASKEPEEDPLSEEAEEELQDSEEAEDLAEEDPPRRSDKLIGTPAASPAEAAGDVAAATLAAPEDPDASEDAETVDLASACWNTVVSRRKQRKPKLQPEEASALCSLPRAVTAPSLTHARADSSSTIKSKGSHEVVTTPSLSHARADSSSTWKSKGSQEAGGDGLAGAGAEKADLPAHPAVSAISPQDSTRASSRGSTPTPKAAAENAVAPGAQAAGKPEAQLLPWSSGVSGGKHYWAYNCGTVGGSDATTIVASMHRTFLSVTRPVLRRTRRASL
jgi:hypothetical protein